MNYNYYICSMADGSVKSLDKNDFELIYPNSGSLPWDFAHADPK